MMHTCLLFGCCGWKRYYLSARSYCFSNPSIVALLTSGRMMNSVPRSSRRDLSLCKAKLQNQSFCAKCIPISEFKNKFKRLTKLTERFYCPECYQWANPTQNDLKDSKNEQKEAKIKFMHQIKIRQIKGFLSKTTMSRNIFTRKNEYCKNWIFLEFLKNKSSNYQIHK